MQGRVQSIQRYFCGGFLGIITDQHGSPPASDDEEGGEDKDLYMPRDYKAPVKKSKKRFGFMSGGGGQWGQYRKTFTVESVSGGVKTRRQIEGISANKKDISPAMLPKLASMNGMHTIEIISCKLTQQPPFYELYNLVVLRLSKNEIRELLRPSITEAEKAKPKAKAKAKGDAEKDVVQNEKEKTHNLEGFYCDHNLLQNIEPGVFSGSQVANLLVLNLSFNQLSMLPFDFGSGARQLKLLDLSSNRLFGLPESMLDCRSLVVLNVDHNELERLPQEIGVLTGLRKLFASYNNLGELPNSIGGCRLLEKIRLVSNHIAYMPHSLLNLWKAKGGYLDELLVEGNPLMQPSITAFQMGGLDRALRLFGEYVREGEQKRREAEELLAQKALQALEGGDKAGEADPQKALQATEQAAEDAAQKSGPAPTSTSQTADAEHHEEPSSSPREKVQEGPEMELVNTTVKGRRMSVVQLKEPEKKVEAEVAIGDPGTALAAGDMYYFGHMNTDSHAVLDVRSAETMLLLRKKQSYVQTLKAATMSLAKTSHLQKEDLPHDMQQLLMVDFDVSRFAGRVEVMDLDMYFCLLVYGAKSTFTSIYLVWDKFETGGKDHMTQDEWLNLCTRIKTKLPTKARMDLWEYLAWRDPDKIHQSDFVAGWHIHDTEISDPHILRMAQVLKLDFYGMSIKELEKRLKLRLGEDADLSMFWEHRVAGEGEHRPHHHDALGMMLRLGEGERRTPNPQETQELRERQNRRDALQEAGAKEAAYDIEDAMGAGGEAESESHHHHHHHHYFQISLDAIEVQDSDSSDGGESMDSFCLSHSEASSQESFDGQFAVLEQEALEYRASFNASATPEGTPRSQGIPADVEDDEDIARLMEVPPHVLLHRQQMQMQEQFTGTAPKQMPKRKKKAHREEKMKRIIRDHRFKTDVMHVRQAIRGAFRNMPFTDFKALVTYFSRNLKRFKSSVQEEGALLYLHADDPIFRCATGIDEINPYAKELMLEMGFICLMGELWVWPCRHLPISHDDEVGLWLPEFVPATCPGKDKRRLHDMVELINLCKATLQREGSDFTGHMRH